jgi:hypothetical protein
MSLVLSLILVVNNIWVKTWKGAKGAKALVLSKHCPKIIITGLPWLAETPNKIKNKKLKSMCAAWDLCVRNQLDGWQRLFEEQIPHA